MNRHVINGVLCGTAALSLTAAGANADDLLLAVIEFNGLPTGVRLLDPQTGAILGDFVVPDFANNGMLWPVEAIAPGPNRTVLFGQPGGDGAISQYDEHGNFLGVYLGLIADPNPVDNIRSMVVSSDGQFLYTSDWDDSDDVHRFNLADATPAGIGNDPLGKFIFGSQDAPELGQPQALEMLRDGDLLVGDLRTRRLMRYDASTGARIGEFSPIDFVGSIPDIDQLPDGSVVSSEDGTGNRVRHFAEDGTILAQFGFKDPGGIHVLPNGDFLVGSNSTLEQGKGLFRVSPNGTILETIDSSRGYGAIELITLIETVCDADLNGDGVLDFFDVSIFLALFTAGNLTVDFTGDGVLNFFDVAEFLVQFNSQCL